LDFKVKIDATMSLDAMDNKEAQKMVKEMSDSDIQSCLVGFDKVKVVKE